MINGLLKKRDAKKHLVDVLTKNQMINESIVDLVNKTDINALLICETNIDPEIVIKAIEEDVDEKYQLLKIDLFRFIVVEK